MFQAVLKNNPKQIKNHWPVYGFNMYVHVWGKGSRTVKNLTLKIFKGTNMILFMLYSGLYIVYKLLLVL